MTSPASTAGSMRLGWAAFFTSAGLLGFELALMRVLLAASWHHFAFLVISVVLLGFGASGTALFLLRGKLVALGERALFVLMIVSGSAMPILCGLTQHVPIEARLVPALMWRQIGTWVLYWALLGVPFFLGAAALGLTLMLARQGVTRVYAANLIGSAVGSVLLTAAMNYIPPEWLALLCGAFLWIGALGLRSWSATARAAALVTFAAAITAYLVVDPPHIRLDPYKYGAYAQRLADQGSAQRLGVTYGPRAVVEAYGGEVFHDLPFLSGAAPPPPMSVLLADGHWIGSVVHVSEPGQAAALEDTVTAFAYAVAPQHPNVLLLGEGGGANVWLAARHDAAQITVVQPDAKVTALLRGPLRERGGAVLELPSVRAVIAEPRHFVDHTAQRFDLIQLVTLESSAAGSGGIGGLGQDHLTTVEGMTACIARLKDDGVLSVTRGIQIPPRDNLKLFATLAAALRRMGVASPAAHVVIVRDFLAVCTMVKASPWTREQIERVREACEKRGLTPVWFSGIRTDELNRPDELPGPPDSPADWYHYAARELFGRPETHFPDQWPFYIHPPTDQSPFFLDFCKLRSIPELQRAFGDLWLTRAELGFLFVLAAIVIVGIVGAALTVLPLAWSHRAASSGGRMVTASYFSAIGLGYLVLEMAFLSRMTYWIGDPVSAAAVTISAFLFFSGLGSLCAQRATDGASGALVFRRVVVALIVVGLIEILAGPRLSAGVGGLGYMARCSAAVAAIAPLAFLMGFPMPAALRRLDASAPALVPWAWAVNGFASVLAPPIAVAIG
ncbi:MAG: hypothetical protein AAB363_08520, partial [Planctomycetota bacterium]